MALNEILGAGYSPRTNPATLTLNQTTSFTGTQTTDFDLTINDPIQLQYLQINVINDASVAGAYLYIPTISLIINNKTVETIPYTATLGDLQNLNLHKIIYAYQSQRADVFERGTVIRVRVLLDQNGASVAVNITTNITLLGQYF